MKLACLYAVCECGLGESVCVCACTSPMTHPVDGALEEVQVREGALDVLVDLEQQLLVLEVCVPRARLLRVQRLQCAGSRSEWSRLTYFRHKGLKPQFADATQNTEHTHTQRGAAKRLDVTSARGSLGARGCA